MSGPRPGCHSGTVYFALFACVGVSYWNIIFIISISFRNIKLGYKMGSLNRLLLVSWLLLGDRLLRHMVHIICSVG